MANIERMFDLMAIEPTVVDIPDAAELKITQGSITFHNVDFSYQSNRSILKNVSFTVPAGRKVAVVGASGGGKSTLVKLLFRFYDPTSGYISIDGQDIHTVTQDSLRRAIGIVPQDTVLFNDSIFENIRYGRPEAGDDEVREAIRLAHLGEFIDALPEGADSIVGERGLKLSGGEKQRVSIARAILKRPPILIFDEATSSLDSRSEQAILKALSEISSNHTSLVIAHRLSTILDADQIVVLDHGEVVEQGDHAGLLAQDGRYAELWRIQQQKRKPAVLVSDAG
jgi:ATP-binding cassette subfamily B protein